MSDVVVQQSKDKSVQVFSVNQLKKQERYESIKQRKKEKRKEVKRRQKATRQQEGNNGIKTGGLSKREYKDLTKQKLQNAFSDGVKVVINCSFDQNMNHKECCKLAGQIRRLYGANCKAKLPFHIYLTSMNEDGLLFRECIRQNDGFLQYMLDRTDLPMEDVFPVQDIVLLTPDSENARRAYLNALSGIVGYMGRGLTVLTDIDPERIYVINGLVDHQVLKGQSCQLAANLRVRSARLPITEHMERVEGFKGNSSLVLTVNQVFEILLDFYHSREWIQCLEAHVPKRKGWVVKGR